MKNKDIISGEEFSEQMSRRTSKSPQRDSPGDSGTDSREEADMGVEYQPTKPKNKKDIPAFDS